MQATDSRRYRIDLCLAGLCFVTYLDGMLWECKKGVPPRQQMNQHQFLNTLLFASDQVVIVDSETTISG